MTAPRPVSLTPHLFVHDARAAVAFYEEVFGGHEILRQAMPDGTLLFSEIALGDARLLLSEETPSLGALAPPTIGGSPVLLTIAVDDPDATAALAIERGAEVEMAVSDSFWGERYGVIRDPFGHRWAVTTEHEDLSPDEMMSRGQTYWRSP